MAAGGNKGLSYPAARQTGSHGEPHQLNYVLLLFLILALYILLHATLTGITYTPELWSWYMLVT